MVLLTVLIVVVWLSLGYWQVSARENQRKEALDNIYAKLSLLSIEDEYLLHLLQFNSNLQIYCDRFRVKHKEFLSHEPDKITIYCFGGLHFIRKLRRLGENELRIEQLLNKYHQTIFDSSAAGNEKSERVFTLMKSTIEEFNNDYYQRISPADSYTWGALALNDIFKLKYADYILGNRTPSNYLGFEEISQRNALEFHAEVMSLIDSFYKNLDEAKIRVRAQ